MLSRGALLIVGAIAAATLSATLPADASTRLNWTFTGADGTDSGSGVMVVGTKGLVTAFHGTFDGKTLAFYAIGTLPGASGGLGFNPNDPSAGYNTLHGVPNTGGADYIFDDKYIIGTGVDAYGILTSTGKGASRTFYDISLDNPGAAQTDFFSITPTGAYVFDDGTFVTTPYVAPAFARFDGLQTDVPEPSTWALMLAGFCSLGAAMRMRAERAPDQD